jgi:hypothetical protein
MARIDQVIVTVDVIDVDIIVVVIPAGRPRVGVLKIIAAVIKAAIIAAPHVEMMLAPETGPKLLVRNTPATASALISVSAVVVLFGLLRTLLVLRTILLLSGPGLVIPVALVLLLGAVILLRAIILCCGPGPLVAIAIVLLLLLGTIILLRGFRVILGLWLPVRFLLGFVGGLFLILPAFIRLFALFGLFLFFWFFLRLIFVRFLCGTHGSGDKKEHQSGAKDELHLIPPVVGDVMSRRIRSVNELGLAGMLTSNTATHHASIGRCR